MISYRQSDILNRFKGDVVMSVDVYVTGVVGKGLYLKADRLKIQGGTPQIRHSILSWLDSIFSSMAMIKNGEEWSSEATDLTATQFRINHFKKTINGHGPLNFLGYDVNALFEKTPEANSFRIKLRASK